MVSTPFNSVHYFFKAIWVDISDLYPREVDGKWFNEWWDDSALFEKQLFLYLRYKEYIKSDPFLDSYKNANRNMQRHLDFIIYHYLLKQNTADACGGLLDDYLQILGRDDYRRQLIGTYGRSAPRIEDLNFVLKKAAQVCAGKRTFVLDVQKKYNN